MIWQASVNSPMNKCCANESSMMTNKYKNLANPFRLLIGLVWLVWEQQQKLSHCASIISTATMTKFYFSHHRNGAFIFTIRIDGKTITIKRRAKQMDPLGVPHWLFQAAMRNNNTFPFTLGSWNWCWFWADILADIFYSDFHRKVSNEN